MGAMGDDGDREAPPGESDDEEGPASTPIPASTRRGPHLKLTAPTLAELTGAGPESASPSVDPGPRPRSLSKARIDVKSDPVGPRIRSNKLKPLRRVRTTPTPLLSLQTPDTAAAKPPDPPSLATETVLPQPPPLAEPTEPAPNARSAGSFRLLMPLQILSALLLFEAALLPALRARALVAPWSALTDPASPNFVASAFLALLALLFAFPLGRVLRVGLTAAIAGLLLVFSLVLLRSALAGHAFDGQPALQALFGEGLAAAALVTLAACTLPTALLWRHAVPSSVGARLTASAGVVLVLVVYLGLHAMTPLDTAPIGLIAGSESAFMGDRVAAWLAWPPLLLALPALATWLPARFDGFAGPLAVAFWLTTLAPLLVLVFFVAPSDRWQEVLLPVQITSLLAAGTLLSCASLGHLLAFLEAGDE